MTDELLMRYTPTQRYKIHEFMKVLAQRSRKSKRISESKQQKIAKSWEEYDCDVVISAMEVYMNMRTSNSANENYVRGIMRNKQKEKEARLNGKNSRGNNRKVQITASESESRTGRELAELARERNINTDCDF